MTEESLQSSAQLKFEDCSSAKFLFTGKIVPELQLKQCSAGGEPRKFVLSLGTTSNLLYHISFDPYFLKKEETVYVEPVVQIQLAEDSGVTLADCFLKNFQIVSDADSGEDVHVYGLALSPQVHRDARAITDKSVHLWYAS